MMTGTDYRGQKYGIGEAPRAANRQRGEHSAASYRLLRVMLLTLCVLLVWGVISWLLSLIPLQKVQVEGLTRYSEEELLLASGLSTTQKLLDADAEQVEASLPELYPYVRSARLRYSFPMSYRLVIEEEEPVYYTQIANDYFALSAELKVLERATSPRRFLDEDLQQITLSGIRSAMLGETLNYGGDYLNRVLEEINASVLGGRVTDVVVGDYYHLSVVCDDLHTVYLGDTHSIDAKLQLGALMLQDANIPQGYRAVLDVSNLKKTSIRVDGMRDVALSAAE